MVRSPSFYSGVYRNFLAQTVVLLVVALLTPVCRAIHFTNTNWDARPGEFLHLTWADQVKWATITLMSGQPEHSMQEDNDPVISYSQDLELQWRVPEDKPEGDYFLLIHDVTGNTNYSPVFRLAQLVPGTVTASAHTLSAVTITTLPFTTSVPYFTSTTLLAATATTTDSNNSVQSNIPQTLSDLSTGTKAGIAVGGTIGILAVLGGMSYFFYRLGASRRDGADASESPGGRRHPWKRKRLHSRGGSDIEGGETGKFRSPTPTPKELSGEDKLPPELASDVGPTEIGTDWPVVAELSAGELCIQEMEQECGEIKLSPLTLSGSESEYRPGEKSMVSPLTPAPPDMDNRENEKCLKVSTGVTRKGHDVQEAQAVEIQIRLKDDTDSNASLDRKG